MIDAESRPGRGFHDDQLRPRDRHRLHQALHEPRHQHFVQGAPSFSLSLSLSLSVSRCFPSTTEKSPWPPNPDYEFYIQTVKLKFHMTNLKFVITFSDFK